MKTILQWMTVAMAGTLVGCGATKVAEPKSPPPNGGFDPIVIEEEGGDEGTVTYQEVVLGPEDERIEVPGSQFGPAPKPKKAPKKKRGKKGAVKNPRNPAYWPYSEAVADQMEGLQWGMSLKRVFAHFEQKIKESYEVKLKAATGDLLAEDRIRTDMYKELNKFKKSYVAFNGQTTGYEAHMVDAEFTHNNNESMLVWDAGKYVEYLFFINNRFWKRVRLFRVDELGGITFADFLATMEGVFGVPGLELVNDDGELDKVVWRDDDTYVAALDGSKFFGVFGLRLSSAVTETHLAKLRVNKDKDKGSVGDDVSDLVREATTSVDMADHNEGVVDQYTGGSDQQSGGGAQSTGQAPQKDNQSGGSDDIDDLF